MDKQQPNNPLHGVKLADIVEYLYNEFGWEQLGKKIKINSFTKEPSVKSSLKFLRRTDWARKEVEELYIRTVKKNVQRRARNKPVESKPKNKIISTESKTEVSQDEKIVEKNTKPKAARKFSRKKIE